MRGAHVGVGVSSVVPAAGVHWLIDVWSLGGLAAHLRTDDEVAVS